MGTRGPKPTPTKVLQMRGSWRGKTRPHEPKPKVEKPSPPSWLTDEGKTIFRHLANQLHAIGLLGKLDQHALGRYCALFLRWRKMEDFIAQYGETYPENNDKGEFVRFALHPQVGLAGQLADKLMRLEQHFGMTPAARAQVGLLLAQKSATDDGKEAGDSRRFLKFG